MARHIFKLPDVGEGTTEAEIVKWHVKVGDEVKEEQPLVDIMTDKATVEVASPVAGRVVRLVGEEGARSAVGSELAEFETGVESEAKTQPVPEKREQLAPARKPRKRSGKVLASPAVRARAKALSIDLATISGKGEDGRVLHSDLDALLTRRASDASPEESLAPPPPGAEDIKVFGLRRRIAERMLESTRTIPHFTYVEEVDMTALEEVRARLNAKQGDGQRISILPHVIQAVIKAIREHPGVNAHYHEKQGIIRRFTTIHVGIATQTERGLLVPVIDNAQEKDIRQLANAIARLSAEARNGKSNPRELSGSTITVTSLGALGGIAATPILNPPEVAIVGVNKLSERPVVIDGAIVIRKMMNLSSSFDHRIVDGSIAASFIQSVKRELEQFRFVEE